MVKGKVTTGALPHPVFSRAGIWQPSITVPECSIVVSGIVLVQELKFD